MGKPRGPERNTGRYDEKGAVRREDFERDMRSLDRRMGEPRTVSTKGRAGWERGVDEGRAPTHRQVFRTSGGTAGATKRSTHALGQDGQLYLNQRQSRSAYSNAALTADLLRFVRQLKAHVRFTSDVDAGEDSD